MNTAADVLITLLLLSGMLAMGTATNTTDIVTRLRSPAALLTTLVINLAVIPAVAVAALTALDMHSPPAMALVLVAASPGGGTGALLAFHARGDVGHAIALQVLLGGASLIAAPFWLAVYTAFTTSTNVPTGPVALALVGYQLLPLAVALSLSTARPRLAQALHSITRRIADVSLAVLIVVLIVSSGRDLATVGVGTFVGLGLLMALTLIVGGLTPGTAAVQRSAAMTTIVRNLSLALMAAKFTPDPSTTALTILTYGLGMYLLAIAFIAVSRSGRFAWSQT